MISHYQTHLLSQTPQLLSFFPTSSSSSSLTLNTNLSNLRFPQTLSLSRSRSLTPMSINSKLSNGIDTLQLDLPQQSELDRIAQVANTVADAAGEVIRKYFRNKFEILDKEDQSPVTIADKEAEESMVSIILENFPSHAIYGEENGWRCTEKFSDFVWVLDPIDGTKSFITGKPVFGTLIALLYRGTPILGIINQPVLRERWIGISGRRTTLNGQEVSTRSCPKLSQAYLYD
ncbi:bifunctional phosphatase IMPL2, chloroplastic [Quercus suber]|uniref:Bifunctional phosphatase impl2 n=1 Tax=Quercus suber TaxID=58331 RepID=A0AAW0KS88_QUESU